MIDLSAALVRLSVVMDAHIRPPTPLLNTHIHMSDLIIVYFNK